MNFKQKRIKVSHLLVLGLSILLGIKLFFFQVINSNYYQELVTLKIINEPLTAYKVNFRNSSLAYKNAQLMSFLAAKNEFKIPPISLMYKNPFLFNVVAFNHLQQSKPKPSNNPKPKTKTKTKTKTDFKPLY
jgi:hypothetical protein